MKKVYFLLSLVVIFSFILRVYKIDSVPSSLTWDEAAVGYNAYTIANFAKDEYGKFLPLYFKSFGEDKQPIHVYSTAFFVKLFGLSEFTVRIPASILGTLNVLLIFFLAKTLFNSNLIGLISSLFLSLSPQNIFFSRFNHEANFALFFFMLGLLLFFKAVKGKKDYLPLSIITFLLSGVSYHAAEIIVPLVVVFLFVIYFKVIYENKANMIIISFILIGFTLICLFNPQLLGVARYNQTIQGKVDIEKTEAFKKTHNLILGKINLTLNQYLWHFDPKFLFESGDKNPKLSSQGSGEFYKIDALFLSLGLIHLLLKRSKKGLVVFVWALLAPLPSSLFAEAPHAGRSAFMMGSFQIIAALGFYTLINLFKKPIFKWVIASVCIVVLLISLINFLKFYLNEFPKRYAIDWQYGYKQVVEYVKNHQDYDQVYVTAVRAQPYIFFLYYLNQSLSDYLNTVIYNNGSDKSSNNVAYFDKYSFGGWDFVEGEAHKKVLYVLSPSEYDGLKGRSNFDIKKVVYYPNGTTAFFLVALK